MPLENVLVAVFDWRMLPPVMRSPCDDESPPVMTPPVKVEDAVEVEVIEKMVEVEYAVIGPAMVVVPCTERAEPGVDVPMPKRRLVGSTARKSIESMTLVEE